MGAFQSSADAAPRREAYASQFASFFREHCEFGDDLFCPFNEVFAAATSYVPGLASDPARIKVVWLQLSHAPGVALKGTWSDEPSTDYVYCVGVRLKSFPRC